MSDTLTAAALIERLDTMDDEELDRLQAAVDRRRRQLAGDEELPTAGGSSTIVERRPYGSGVLQLEKRGESGPYWDFPPQGWQAEDSLPWQDGRTGDQVGADKGRDRRLRISPDLHTLRAMSGGGDGGTIYLRLPSASPAGEGGGTINGSGGSTWEWRMSRRGKTGRDGGSVQIIGGYSSVG